MKLAKPKIISNRGQKLFNIIIATLLLVCIGLFGYAFWYNATHPSEPKISTSSAVATPQTPRSILSASVNSSGDLIFTYDDGATFDAGHVVGHDGAAKTTAISPSNSQVAAAVAQYCASGKCDGKQPTASQVSTAVTEYCSGGKCLGKDGTNATPQMVAYAVANYCSENNQCRGDKGSKGDTGATGATGQAGRTPQLSCVIRWDADLPTVTRYYVAWKYSDEATSAYRDMYRVPSQQASGMGCEDLRA